ncbi:hypothetical protein [Planctomicrobium piriforme]|uniref:Uncharacterized protein n=1 Tax=Planctomicrobium piriforme TaxID=1576369 RepID=A0A1I3KC51_9PLAN|nr:hypothetical protein [Planctomicrobium piriforme]SFI70062.1 hypothetical protein SAMN05421753_111183 [Planctomicrobium piriforme]
MPLSEIEEIYRQRVSTMTPAEKFQRMHTLNQWARWNIARTITEKEGPLPPEVLKWRVALWIYGRNSECRRLIEGQLERVSS